MVCSFSHQVSLERNILRVLILQTLLAVIHDLQPLRSSLVGATAWSSLYTGHPDNRLVVPGNYDYKRVNKQYLLLSKHLLLKIKGLAGICVSKHMS